MSLIDQRKICENCNQTLPRAAFGRCPLCRQPVATASSTYVITCRRCDNDIPKANAGKCPTCSADADHALWASMRKARRS